jgi:hypothetical protein
MLVSSTAIGCSHFGDAGFAVVDWVDLVALAFGVADFNVEVFAFVFAGVVVEV